jgi:hypothetical protein
LTANVATGVPPASSATLPPDGTGIVCWWTAVPTPVLVSGAGAGAAGSEVIVGL